VKKVCLSTNINTTLKAMDVVPRQSLTMDTLRICLRVRYRAHSTFKTRSSAHPDMRAILNAIEAAHQAVKLTGAIHAESVCLSEWVI
jgi:hypothetical protein